MAHLVVHHGADGRAQLDDVATLEAALARVEHLRNVEGVTDVRVFEELELEVRTYYRVAVAGRGERPTPPPAPAEVAVPDTTGGDRTAETSASGPGTSARPQPGSTSARPQPDSTAARPQPGDDEVPPGVFPLTGVASSAGSEPLAAVAAEEPEPDGAAGTRRVSRFGRDAGR